MINRVFFVDPGRQFAMTMFVRPFSRVILSPLSIFSIVLRAKHKENV